jgi:hypothetical protein
VWLNDELTAKVDSLIELRRKYNDLEAELSTKLADVRMPWQVLFFIFIFLLSRKISSINNLITLPILIFC